MPVIGGTRPTVPGNNNYTPPASMAGLIALNPKLAGHLAADPGLRAFLEMNQSHFADAQPKGAVHDSVKLDSWCHATSIVPASVRDEEYIFVVARGSAYPDNGDIKFPLQGGGEGKSDGRLLFAGKTKDFIATFKDDHDPHYPGAGAVTLQFPVYGKAGEKVELTYCRFKPDAQGKAHPSQAGWPDSFTGVYGGYAGRDREVTLKGGVTTHIPCPD